MRCSTLLLGALAAATSTAHTVKSRTNYTVVTGIFLQDDPATDASTFNFTASNFGLIDRSYPSDSTCPDSKHATGWQRLAHYISRLNHLAPKTERYTLLFLGRHGEGYHNAAESFFGTPAWNCYWSERDGNDTTTWADAQLTPTGVQQAHAAHRFWQHLLADEKITPPQTYYTSPLSRCLATARLTFAGLALPRGSPFAPTVKERFREGVSAHTCDRRSTRSYIRENFPGYRFERGFAERDPLWTPLFAETSAAQDVRSKAVLDDVFASDASTYISVTSHSGEIASLLRVLGHRVFRLETGAAIPVLVKVTTLRGAEPPTATTTLPFAPQKTCATPPSIRDSSCNDCSCCT